LGYSGVGGERTLNRSCISGVDVVDFTPLAQERDEGADVVAEPEVRNI
jgi:hypothetical protein